MNPTLSFIKRVCKPLWVKAIPITLLLIVTHIGCYEIGKVKQSIWDREKAQLTRLETSAKSLEAQEMCEAEITQATMITETEVLGRLGLMKAPKDKQDAVREKLR